MQFHPGFPPARALIRGQVRQGPLRIAQLVSTSRNQSGDFDWQIALPESGHGIVVGIRTSKLMGAAAAQVQLQLALFRLGNYNRILRQGETRAVLSSGLRQKYAVPLDAA